MSHSHLVSSNKFDKFCLRYSESVSVAYIPRALTDSLLKVRRVALKTWGCGSLVRKESVS